MKPRWTAAAIVAAFGIALLPMAANAAPLPAPAPSTPTAGTTVDQPVFSWAPVDGAAKYEIEVALDDQFVTVTDPGDEIELRVVHGTTYIPTFSYTAKTHYWHVRAVAADGTKGEWSDPWEFTRRWTNDAEAAGTESDVPSSRVENVRLVDGGTTPALNKIAITWDPVPGAAFYQVQVDGPYADAVCTTPHTTLAPPFHGKYELRSAIGCDIDIQSPIRAWVEGAWSSPGPGTVAIESADAEVGDLVYVRFLDSGGDSVVVPAFSATVTAAGGDPRAFTVDAATIPVDPEAIAEYFVVSLPFEADGSYSARVRAVDAVAAGDYPLSPVVGMWSNQRPEPTDPMGSWLTFTVAAPDAGSGSLNTPAVPTDLLMEGTDVPTLSWEPAPGADAYAVTVALDRDFTNPVAHYTTRSATLVPPETYDDNGPARSYYWHVEPCIYTDVTQTDVICLTGEIAINDPTYVGRFAKRSTPITGLTATSLDDQTNTLLRWGDALTAAQALDASYTPGGVEKYEIQITDGDWAQANKVFTDNLAYSTAADTPLTSGTYRWRVRPYDGQEVPLAWATGPDFTIVQPKEPDPDPDPSPSGSTPNPGSSTPGGFPTDDPTPTGPAPVYQAPPADDGTATDLPPEKPGKPGVKRSGKKYLRIHWRASEEFGSPVSQYLVYRSKNGTKFSVAKRTTSRTARVKAAKKKTYWFYVVADSEAGRSDRSSITKFPK